MVSRYILILLSDKVLNGFPFKKMQLQRRKQPCFVRAVRYAHCKSNDYFSFLINP